LRWTQSIGIVGLCCVLSSGCAATDSYSPQTYVVRSKDTLYSIAWRHGLDYRDLAAWNKLGPDFRISIGQILWLRPPTGMAAQQRPAGAARVPPSLSQVSPHVPAPPVQGSMSWIWPTDAISEPRPVPGGGILLSGTLGQSVRAACAGRVVYTGSGLRGYGNLIIIKHGEGLLSAYAHNRELLVHEGEEVAGGQEIAHMGEGARLVPTLYFEIRQNGKPVDPLGYLPKTK
jgi:lipoprotein NlpD